MSHSPKISVILPFYNARYTLDRAISSIANQTFKNWECVLADNNSTDGSRQIAESWCRKDNRFRLIAEVQQGVVFASNAAAKEACENFIARMDADDVAMPERLEKQYQFLQQHSGYDVVSGKVIYKGHRKDTGGFRRYVGWVNSVDTYNKILNQRFIESPVVNPTAMWRRDVAEKLGLYRHGDFPEDYEMWLRWLAQGAKIGKVPETILEWHDSDKRLTRTQPIYKEEAFYRIKSQYLVQYLEQVNPFHPKAVVWGASRISRKWLGFIEERGIEIEFFIDTKPHRKLSKPVLHYENIPAKGTCFILVYMKNEDIRRQINQFLVKNSFLEGVHFLHVS